jgi:hypothetical protein
MSNIEVPQALKDRISEVKGSAGYKVREQERIRIKTLNEVLRLSFTTFRKQAKLDPIFPIEVTSEEDTVFMLLDKKENIMTFSIAVNPVTKEPTRKEYETIFSITNTDVRRGTGGKMETKDLIAFKEILTFYEGIITSKLPSLEL